MTAETSIRMLSDVLMFDHRYIITWASFVAQLVKNLPAKQETWVPSLGWEDPLKKGMATHSSILACRIPWTEEPARLQSIESQKVRHDFYSLHLFYSPALRTMTTGKTIALTIWTFVSRECLCFLTHCLGLS